MSDITKDQVVEWLSGQSVVEISELVKELEEKWGVSAAAPVAAVAAAPAAGGDGGGEAAAEKDEFDIEIAGFDSSKKIAIIKEVRGITGLGLKEAKEMVEGQTDEEVKNSGVIIQRRPKLDEEKIVLATAILSEIDMDHMYIFSNHKFVPGQSIVIDFVVPKRFTVNADVYYCREYNMRSRIISDKKLPYRIAVKFSFLKEGERTLLRNFVTSIEPDVEASMPVPKMNKNQDSDDEDFDELDDFDL